MQNFVYDGVEGLCLPYVMIKNHQITFWTKYLTIFDFVPLTPDVHCSVHSKHASKMHGCFQL